MTQTTPAYDIFLSYAPADEAWVDGYLLDALRSSGLNVLTQEDFQSGRPLLAEYERAVVQSRYVVLVLSPAWTGDRFGEFVDLLTTYHGNSEGTWPVVPLILQPVELPLRLAHLVPVDATTSERWPAALEKITRLLDVPLAPAQEAPDCPYPGMTPFTTEQESLFFGRDREIADAIERLRLHPFLCVIGQRQIVPRLRRCHPRPAPFPPIWKRWLGHPHPASRRKTADIPGRRPQFFHQRTISPPPAAGGVRGGVVRRCSSSTNSRNSSPNPTPPRYSPFSTPSNLSSDSPTCTLFSPCAPTSTRN